MAERDLSTHRPDPPPRSWSGWVVLGALLLTTLVVALAHDERRLDAQESAAVLGAASIVGDGDLAFGDGDRARLVDLGNAARPALRTNGERQRLDVSPLAAGWLAPWVALAPRTGAVFATWVALVVAALALTRGLSRQLADAAPWWTSAAIWGSGAFAGALRLGDETLVLALLTVGLALILSEGGTERAALGEMWNAEVQLSTTRAVAAGVLLGLAAALRPWLVGVLLVAPALLAARGARRPVRLLAAGLGMSIAATAAFVSGAIPALMAAPGAEPTVLWRNAVTMLVGPRFGLLLVAVPTVALVLGLGARGRSRSGLLAVPAVALGWLALAAPFSWSGAPSTLLGPLALAAAATWWLASSAISARSAALVLVIGQVLLAGAWSPKVAVLHQRLLAPVLGWLAWETTQPAMPGESETVAGALLLRSLDANLTPSPDPSRTGALVANGGRGRLLLAAAVPLEQVELRMSSSAPSDLEVGGAEGLETMYRSDGGVNLRLAMDSPIATHADEGGATVVWHQLDLELGEGDFTLEVALP